MPVLISPIDEICRQKQRDVLTVEFHCYETNFLPNFNQLESRQLILDWFEENDVPYYLCGPFANDVRTDRYRGQVYIDVPFNRNDELYLKIEEFLANPDDSMKFEGAFFICYSLADCMANAHHDDED